MLHHMRFVVAPLEVVAIVLVVRRISTSTASFGSSATTTRCDLRPSLIDGDPVVANGLAGLRKTVNAIAISPYDDSVLMDCSSKA